MSGAVFNKWVWLIVVSVVLIMVVPFIVVLGILALPSDLRLVATIIIVILWGVAAGYKEWIRAQRGEHPEKK